MAQSRRVVSKFNSRLRIANVLVADEKFSSKVVAPPEKPPAPAMQEAA